MSNRTYAKPDERWIVRRDGRHRARYYQGPHVGVDYTWGRWQRGAFRMTREAAELARVRHGGRVVRLVSRAEAVAKARAAGRAEGLRAAVDAIDDYRIDWAEGTAENVNRVRVVVDAMAVASEETT